MKLVVPGIADEASNTVVDVGVQCYIPVQDEVRIPKASGALEREVERGRDQRCSICFFMKVLRFKA